jgi:hypothetical protein
MVVLSKRIEKRDVYWAGEMVFRKAEESAKFKKGFILT